MTEIPYKLGVQQRMLPNYRAPFFELLGTACTRGLSLFAGKPHPKEAVEQQQGLTNARLVMGRNLHILSGAFYSCWQSGLFGWLQSWQPEVLVMEANPRYLSSPKAMRWMRSRKAGLVGWGLGAPPSSRIQEMIWRRFLAGFDVLIAYSQRGAQEYIRLGFDPQRTFVAPNAVAPRPAHELPIRPVAFPNGRATVLYVGRLQARKRVDLLLLACASLLEELRPHVWIVGEGPARAALETLAKDIYPAAQFLGACYGNELEEYFARADLFVLPGTGGLAVQQAMSFGLPVIVAEADGTQSNLVRPTNGWVIPGGDPTALRTAIQDALSDAERLRRMGAASFDIVANEINLENMVNVFSQAVTTAAGHAARRL